MNNEIWKGIKWYEWKYEISDTGLCRSLYYVNKYWKSYRIRLLKWSNSLWYQRVTLQKEWKRKHLFIHRLVAFAFIPNLENKPQVNHIDWNKLNNSIHNLEWCTAKENIQHAFRTWLNKVSENNFILKNNPNKWKFGKDNHLSKRVLLIKDWIETIFESVTNASKETWICLQSISHCCRWKWKTAGWFIFKYL